MRISEPFTLNVPIPYNIPGNFFYVDSVPAGSITVKFFRNGRQLPEDLSAVIAGWYAAPDGGFSDFEVTSTLTQVIAFYVAKGRVGSNVFSGNVTVLDQLQSVSGSYRNQDADVPNNRAFFRGDLQLAVAAQYPHVQLFNPAASGKVVLVDQIDAWVSLPALSCRIGAFNTALATLIGTGFNLNQGAAAAVGVLRRESNVAQLGTLWGYFDISTGVTGGYHMHKPGRPLSRPILLDAGEGLVVVGDAVNMQLLAGFWWREF